MELHLARPDTHQRQVTVTCDDAFSHTFDLHTLIPTRTNGLAHPLRDPVAYGKALYAALFPPDSPAQQALAAKPRRIVLVATDDELDALPWEYAYGPGGWADSYQEERGKEVEGEEVSLLKSCGSWREEKRSRQQKRS